MKVDKSALYRIKDAARAHWLEGGHGLDGAELVVYSYLKAIEQILKVEFTYDLPKKTESITDED